MKNIGNGDASAALSYLQRKAEQDPMFFFKYTKSADDSLENLFWSDETSRLDYQVFGDVMAFDSTYKKNKYNKPVVIFSGYNHHKEATIFACALVCDETIPTYKWVLETLSVAMFDIHPKTIVTDGDKSMREAIKVVFPSTTHRLCGWHIQHVKQKNGGNQAGSGASRNLRFYLAMIDASVFRCSNNEDFLLTFQKIVNQIE